MATGNPFDLLGDDTEDLSQLAAQQQLKMESKKSAATPAAAAGARQQNNTVVQSNLPTKPLPPAQAG